MGKFELVSPSPESEDVGGSEYDGSYKKESSSGSGRSRKFACVECRQQKSKCDAHDRAPEPCTKCQKKGVPCVLKKDFRRTYKRARNEAIEKRFKELTRTLTNLSSEEILKKIEQEQSALLDGQNFTKDKVKRLRQSKLAETGPQIKDHVDANWIYELNNLQNFKELSSEQLKCTPKTLGDIYMSSEDIAELFQEFAKKYHPFLPVVDITKGAEKIYRLSPCLFWVIILTGLRRKFGATELMKKLSNMVKSVLAEITISPIIRYTPSDTDEPVLNVASVYSVQAFLLYTFWPPLTSSLSADTSWNTIGTAMFQAIRVGLNSAEYSKEYATANHELISEQVRTWVCSNIVSQYIASSFGFPAYVSFDHTVINVSRDLRGSGEHAGLPSSIKQMAQIAHFENQVINTMNSNPSNALGMVGGEQKQPLLKVLNQQLSQLEINLEDNDLDSIRKFLLLVAKAHLLTYYFTDAFSTHKKNDNDIRTLSMSEIESNFETKCGLVKVYNASIDLLTHSTNMWQADPAIIKYFPGVFVLNIWQSACIISKLVHSSLSSVLDVSKGKKAYQDAVSLTFNASVLKYDMAYRSSGIMRSMWSMFAKMHDDWKQDRVSQDEKFANDFNLGISVKSRMSVSVFFDCLYILREKCGMAKLKRESKRYEEDFEFSEALQDDARGGEGKPEHQRRLSGIKNPEEDARKIIKTIPLDPNPINASNASSGSSLESPASQTPEGTLLKEMLSRSSPREDNEVPRASAQQSTSLKEVQGIPSSSSSRLPSVFSIKRSQEPVRRISATAAAPSDITAPLASAVPTQSTRDSPNTVMDHWDNWESDMVWKDVDLLMNEFAFNPAV
ncbi:probable Regulatory protein LEU3 [Zygosaccharomyces bailii]|nr:probable Regulatory protein LEU3 [Zygosaccharomyces bailii]